MEAMNAIFRGKSFVYSPKETVVRVIKSSLRSALFLAGYVAVEFCLPCLFRNTFKTDRKWMYYANGFIAGLMVLLEGRIL